MVALTLFLVVSRAQDTLISLDAIEEHMERAKADQSQFAAYTRAQTVKTKTLVDAKQLSTLCAKCVHVCHEGCYLPPIAEKGDREFLKCQCMAGTSHCTDCPGNCSHEVRVVCVAPT